MSTDAYREIAMKLVARAEGDPGFREHVRNDPVDAVRSAGIPEDVARQMLRGPVDEARPLDCMDFTCWSSECPGTCYVSFWGLAPEAEKGNEPITKGRTGAMPDADKIVLTQSQLKLIDAVIQSEIERATGEGVRIADGELLEARAKYAKVIQAVAALVQIATEFIGFVAEPGGDRTLRRAAGPAGPLSLDQLIEARRQLEEDFSRATPNPRR